MIQQLARRIAFLTRLVEKAPSASLGRTALMKLLYFISALRGVDLGYRFTLYSYGPFDSTVLDDADYAARLNAIKVRTVMYPSGYGYVIGVGDAADKAVELATGFVNAHEDDIDWVLAEFGTLGSAELELASTIVFVDQENQARDSGMTVDDITRRVLRIKPHFTEDRVKSRVVDLDNRGFLKAII